MCFPVLGSCFTSFTRANGVPSDKLWRGRGKDGRVEYMGAWLGQGWGLWVTRDPIKRRGRCCEQVVSLQSSALPHPCSLPTHMPPFAGSRCTSAPSACTPAPQPATTSPPACGTTRCPTGMGTLAGEAASRSSASSAPTWRSQRWGVHYCRGRGCLRSTNASQRGAHAPIFDALGAYVCVCLFTSPFHISSLSFSLLTHTHVSLGAADAATAPRVGT